MDIHNILEDKTPFEVIGEPGMLEQLAEECAELCKAALKLSRILRKDNPTPVTEPEARESLAEEATDVILCLKELGIYEDFNLMYSKHNRWLQRLKEKEDQELDQISDAINKQVEDETEISKTEQNLEEMSEKIINEELDARKSVEDPKTTNEDTKQEPEKHHEVLSKEEIDNLLNALSDGDIYENVVEESEEANNG